jgi:NNP family nitrate/nitrite transporter-like MFS transporter
VTSTPIGNLRTLIASFLHFDLCFMLWVLLGSLGISIADAAHLSSAEKGLVVAIPTLSGSLMRIPMGILSDRLGGKRVGAGLLVFLFLPLLLAWRADDNLPTLVSIGLMLGVAGSSFAVALPLASRWYPPERQGLAMGVAAAGNTGTVIANLAAPQLAERFGWHVVPLLAAVPLAIVLCAFVILASDSPVHKEPPPLRQHLATLRHTDLWWFCLLYSVTFGGYVGMGSFLPIFLHDQYGLSAVAAGLVTAGASFCGSAVRPLGGYLSDRLGGVRMLSVVLVAISASYLLASRLPPFVGMLPLLLVWMSCLGLGNGSVFQLVPQRFRLEIGIATGVVGAIGGLGGFELPIVLGSVEQATGSFAIGFVALGIVAALAFAALRLLAAIQHGWRLSFRLTGVQPNVTPEVV